MSEQTKIVYQINYDGSYAGTIILSVEAGDVDPLETKKEGRIVWQIPADCTETEPPPIPEGKRLFWCDGKWVLEDIPPETEKPAPPPEPIPTQEEIQKTLTVAVQAYLDEGANERGYDNILSASSYAPSDHPIYGPEGRICLAWKCAVWDTCHNILDAVTAGQREIPTVEELLAELPELVWPE